MMFNNVEKRLKMNYRTVSGGFYDEISDQN